MAEQLDEEDWSLLTDVDVCQGGRSSLQALGWRVYMILESCYAPQLPSEIRQGYVYNGNIKHGLEYGWTVGSRGHVHVVLKSILSR